MSAQIPLRVPPLLLPALMIVCFAPALPGQAQTRAADSPPPAIVSRAEVYRYPLSDPYDLDNLYGFNHAPSIILFPDGRLLAAWFSGPFEASVHQVILGAFSSDEGKSWSAGQVLHDTPRVSDFDPAFISDGQHTWLFYTAGRWNRYPSVGRGERQAQQVGIKSYKLYARRSDDSGRTWSEPQRVLPDETGYGGRSNGIQLTSGELLLPIYSFEPPYTSSVLKSSDGGQTWKRFGEVSPPGKVGAAEPTIAELKDGTVLMALRTTDGHFWTARSTDKGQSWSEPSMSQMQASASSHHLFRMSDGRIVLTHNECPAGVRTPLTLRVSEDGQTWGKPLVLGEVKPVTGDEPAWDRELSYPSVAQLPGGDLLVVWTWIEMSPDSQWGAIQSARVRVPAAASE